MTDPVTIYAKHLRRRNLAPATCAIYVATARRFMIFVDRPVERVRRTDVKGYLAWRSSVLAPPVQAAELRRVRGFLAALVDEGMIAHSPAEGLTSKRGSYGVQRLLSERTISRLLKAASIETPRGGPAVALRDRALVELAFGLGLRVSELRAALLVDLNLAQGTLLVRRAKRGAPQVLPLPPSSIPHLRAYVREGRPALVQRGRGRDRGHLLLNQVGTPLRGARVHEVVVRVAARARVRAHPHALRRAVATGLVRRGASVLAVQELLGHVRLDTTAIYVEVEREDLRRAVAILER